MTPRAVAPEYGGACIASVAAALRRAQRPSSGGDQPSWVPAPVRGAEQVVLLVLDGLGWEQLGDRLSRAPTLASMAGGPITSVAPTTTAAALTSISTGVAPGEHGVVGYRVHAGGGVVLNTLRWRSDAGDAREAVPPVSFQPRPAFGGEPVPVVTRADFVGSGFTLAHLTPARLVGWSTVSAVPLEVGRLVASGEPFVYAYYDGVDHVAHAHGLGDHYAAELAFADRLVADLLAVLPRTAALVVTADHGQVDVGPNVVPLDAAVRDDCDLLSGEARFLWLHARPGTVRRVAERAGAAHGSQAWVVERQEVIDRGWLGPVVSDEAAARLGHVALVAHAPVAFVDPRSPGESRLVARHGSLTSAEMLVPLLAARGVGGEG